MTKEATAKDQQMIQKLIVGCEALGDGKINLTQGLLAAGKSPLEISNASVLVGERWKFIRNIAYAQTLDVLHGMHEVALFHVADKDLIAEVLSKSKTIGRIFGALKGARNGERGGDVVLQDAIVDNPFEVFEYDDLENIVRYSQHAREIMKLYLGPHFGCPALKAAVAIGNEGGEYSSQTTLFDILWNQVAKMYISEYVIGDSQYVSYKLVDNGF